MFFHFRTQALVIHDVKRGHYSYAASYLAEQCISGSRLLISVLLYATPIFWLTGLGVGIEQYCIYTGLLMLSALWVESLMLFFMGFMSFASASNIGPMVLYVLSLFNGWAVRVENTPVSMQAIVCIDSEHEYS